MKVGTKLAKIKSTLDIPLKRATLCFLVKETQVLLAMKKRGFAQGKWNGVGGKMDDKDKNIEETAIRETNEEIQVNPTSLKQVAVLNFFHLGKTDNNQQVTVYLTSKWEGEPTESEEMAPRWFKINEIPYDEMWEDDRFWLPKVLSGETVEADFLFNKNQVLLEHEIQVTRPAVDIF